MRFIPRLSLAALVLFALVQVHAAELGGGNDTLDFVRDAHRASRETIRTAYCRLDFKVTFRTSGPKSEIITQTCSSRYWYTPDTLRVKVRESGAENDYLRKESVKKNVARRTVNGKTLVGASRAKSPYAHSGRCDAFSRGVHSQKVVQLPSFPCILPRSRKQR